MINTVRINKNRIKLTNKKKKKKDFTEAEHDLIKSSRPNDIVQMPGSTYGYIYYMLYIYTHNEYSGTHTLDWKEKPNNVLIIKKPQDPKTEKALIELAHWLHRTRPDMNIIVERSVAEQFTKELPFVHYLDKGIVYIFEKKNIYIC